MRIMVSSSGGGTKLITGRMISILCETALATYHTQEDPDQMSDDARRWGTRVPDKVDGGLQAQPLLDSPYAESTDA